MGARRGVGGWCGGGRLVGGRVRWVSSGAPLARSGGRPGYSVALMGAVGEVAAAQASWFTAQAVLLAAGVMGIVVWARFRTNVAALAATALVVIGAELVGRIAFYNLWTLPM